MIVSTAQNARVDHFAKSLSLAKHIHGGDQFIITDK